MLVQPQGVKHGVKSQVVPNTGGGGGLSAVHIWKSYKMIINHVFYLYKFQFSRSSLI